MNTVPHETRTNHACGRRKRTVVLRSVTAVLYKGHAISPTYGETLGLCPLLYRRLELEQHSDRVIEAERADDGASAPLPWPDGVETLMVPDRLLAVLAVAKAVASAELRKKRAGQTIEGRNEVTV